VNKGALRLVGVFDAGTYSRYFAMAIGAEGLVVTLPADPCSAARLASMTAKPVALVGEVTDGPEPGKEEIFVAARATFFVKPGTMTL